MFLSKIAQNPREPKRLPYTLIQSDFVGHDVYDVPIFFQFVH